MGISRFFVGATLGATLVGGITAGTTAASGATGAAILNGLGYTGYVASTAANMGAVGGAVLGAGIGGIAGGLAGIGFFNSKDNGNNNFINQAIYSSGYAVIGGLIGNGIMQCLEATVMEIGRTAAAFALGGAVLSISVSVAVVCLAFLLVCTAVVAENTYRFRRS